MRAPLIGIGTGRVAPCSRRGRGLLVVTALGVLILTWAVLPHALGELRVGKVQLHPDPAAFAGRTTDTDRWICTNSCDGMRMRAGNAEESS